MASNGILETQYVHTNAGFSITCSFTGNETPSGVTWTVEPDIGDIASLAHGTDQYALVYDSETKKATLTKTVPTAGDDGTYKCVFDMESEKDYEPSATAVIIVARK